MGRVKEKISLVFFILFSVYLTTGITIPVATQEIGVSIQGKVMDDKGKPVPNAIISVLNKLTGKTVRVTTDKKGRYHLMNLEPGVYDIYCSKREYITEIRENFTPLAEQGVKLIDNSRHACDGSIYDAPQGGFKSYTEIKRRNYQVNFTLRKAEGVEPSRLLEKAVQSFRNGDIDDAITKLNQYKQLVPNNPGAYLLLGRGYYIKKQWDKANKAYERYFFLKPKNVTYQDYFVMGEVSLKLGYKDRAEEYFNKAVEAKPNDPQFCYYIGATYYNSRIYNRAVESFKRALAIKPNYPEALLGLASSYLQLRDWDNTILYFEKYFKIHPNSTMALLGLGEAHYNKFLRSKDRMEAEKAVEYYQKYIELNQNSINAAEIKKKLEGLEKYLTPQKEK